MKNDVNLPPKHVLDHELPTVIHQEEENRTLLAQWLDNAEENPAKFWGVIATVIVCVAALGFFGSGFNLSGSNTVSAWEKLEVAKTAAERVEIAKEFPKTDAERWALLQAATEFFDQGFGNLPENQAVARPTLKKALDLFQKVADEAPKGSDQARLASMGVARTYEARGELAKAIPQYEKVAATKEWAKSREAVEAAKLVELLKKPTTIAFYKDLYEYKPSEVTLPPGGIGDLKLPSPLSADPATKGTGSFLPDLSNVPPPPTSTDAMPEIVLPTSEAEKIAPPADADAPLPVDVFSPGTPPLPVSETKPDAPKA